MNLQRNAVQMEVFCAVGRYSKYVLLNDEQITTTTDLIMKIMGWQDSVKKLPDYGDLALVRLSYESDRLITARLDIWTDGSKCWVPTNVDENYVYKITGTQWLGIPEL